MQTGASPLSVDPAQAHRALLSRTHRGRALAKIKIGSGGGRGHFAVRIHHPVERLRGIAIGSGKIRPPPWECLVGEWGMGAGGGESLEKSGAQAVASVLRG